MSALDGRKADLLVLYTDPTTGAVTMQMVAPGGSGQLVVGIQKLFQRYTRTLLLKKGSMLYRPNDGCVFMLDGDAGLWRTSADVAQSFIASQLDVRRQMIADEFTADPDDERFFDAQLLNIALTPSRVGITVRVISRAGSTFEAITPIATLPR